MEAKIKQFNLQNTTDSIQKVTVDLKEMKLIKGDVDFKELKNDFKPTHIPNPSRHPLLPEYDSESKDVVGGDLELLRLQFCGNGLNSNQFVEQITNYFDSKTPETFSEVNKFIATTLDFMAKQKGIFSNHRVINQITLRKDKDGEPDEKTFNPQNYFSANQFQAGIIDIQLPNVDIIKNYKEIGEMDIDLPSHTTLTVTIF